MLIEVAYAEPARVVVKSYRLEPPATLGDALALVAADADFAGVDAGGGVGICGRIASRDTPLRDGDRVEIYRALPEDPKDARRRRAAAASRSGRS
ncbi:MAG TPA: RnfH family protein [Steroidobacteraceae bacterium]|nr:RnfH family protein [Steroidobacteraceae bacterium]